MKTSFISAMIAQKFPREFSFHAWSSTASYSATKVLRPKFATAAARRRRGNASGSLSFHSRLGDVAPCGIPTISVRMHRSHIPRAFCYGNVRPLFPLLWRRDEVPHCTARASMIVMNIFHIKENFYAESSNALVHSFRKYPARSEQLN